MSVCQVAMLSEGKDLFGAEPFDPFTCGSADFPPDIQSKLDEMQVSANIDTSYFALLKCEHPLMPQDCANAKSNWGQGEMLKSP